MGKCSIRRLTLKDLEDIESTFPVSKLLSYREKLARQSRTGYSLYGIYEWSASRRLVGISQLRRQGPFDPIAQSHSNYPEIGNLYVLEDVRGNGYGTRLIRHIERILSKENYESVGLAVQITNSVALGLYQKLGYAPHVTLQAVDNRPERVYMTKRLN